MLTIDVSSGFDEGALGQPSVRLALRVQVRQAEALVRQTLSKGLCGDVVDCAGSALHLIAATLKELDQLLVLHSEVFGKLVYANTHR